MNDEDFSNMIESEMERIYEKEYDWYLELKEEYCDEEDLEMEKVDDDDASWNYWLGQYLIKKYYDAKWEAEGDID
jgi:hypothetical protein